MRELIVKKIIIDREGRRLVQIEKSGIPSLFFLTDRIQLNKKNILEEQKLINIFIVVILEAWIVNCLR